MSFKNEAEIKPLRNSDDDDNKTQLSVLPETVTKLNTKEHVSCRRKKISDERYKMQEGINEEYRKWMNLNADNIKQ